MPAWEYEWLVEVPAPGTGWVLPLDVRRRGPSAGTPTAGPGCSPSRSGNYSGVTGLQKLRDLLGDRRSDAANLLKLAALVEHLDVGVSTRHAVGHDGGEEGEVDVPRDPAVENFAPREATPPTVVP